MSWRRSAVPLWHDQSVCTNTLRLWWWEPLRRLVRRTQLQSVTCYCSLYQHGRADTTASQTPSFLALFKSRLVLPSSWYRVTQVVVEKRLLNGCSSGCGSGRGRGSGRNSSSSSSSRPSSLCTQLLCSCLNTKLSSCTFCILRKWLSVLNLFDFFELFCCNNRRNNFF